MASSSSSFPRPHQQLLAAPLRLPFLLLLLVLLLLGVEATKSAPAHQQQQQQPFSVVGLYLGNGQNESANFPLEKLRWDVYSTIQLAALKVSPNGTASCPDDPLFLKGRAVARAHGKQIQFGAAWTFGGTSRTG